MTSKIKIKMGAIEIEYEGSEQFLKDELPELLSAVSNLYKASAPLIDASNVVTGTEVGSDKSSEIVGTTGTLAAELGGGTGPDLAMSAAARLTFVLKKDKYSRNEILEEMKSASAYYKTSYSSNLTSILNGLIKNKKLMEPAKDTYSLSADSRKSLEAKLV